MEENQKETIDELKEYREKLAQLSEEEKIKRDLYLKKLSNGELQGPETGFPSIDKKGLKYFDDNDFNYSLKHCKIYDQMIEETKKFSHKTCMEYSKIVKISYSKDKKMIEKVAKSLKEYGIKSGDIVSVCLPNIPEVDYVFYAINRIGATANMLDPRTNESTLGRSVLDAKSKLLISLDSICNKFYNVRNDTNLENIVYISPLESIPKLLHKAILKKKPDLKVELPKDKIFISFKDFLNKGKNYKGKIDSEYCENSTAVIAYTGGTTGMPKGTKMSNLSFTTMVVENSKEHFNMKPGDRCLVIAPPWTFYGVSNNLNAFKCMGGQMIMVPDFGPNDLGQLILNYKPSHVITVPSSLIGMMNDPDIVGKNLSFVKTIIVGADRLDETLENNFNLFLTKHNCQAKVSKGYGMTEVNAAASFTKENSNDIGSVGIPFIAENVSVFGTDKNGNFIEKQYGEQGELAINSPKLMQGYFGENDSKTNDVLKRHSDNTTWAHTGDIGHLDENGKIYVDGRIKRMFVKNGFKIFPSEVESSIMKSPYVEMCAVVQVKDKINGFIAKAFIVLKNEYKELENNDKIKVEILNVLKSNLYDYEIPDMVEFRDKLPLTGMNKVDFKFLENEAVIEEENGVKTR